MVRARTRDATVDEAWQLGPSSLKRPQERAARVPPSCRRERGCVTAVAPRPILILPSQAKVTGGPWGRRRGRGRAKSVGFAVVDEPTGAAGFVVASDTGGRTRAAKPAAGTPPQTRSRGRHSGRDGTLIADGCDRSAAAEASRFVGRGTGSRSRHGRIGRSKTGRGTGCGGSRCGSSQAGSPVTPGAGRRRR